MKKSTLAIAIAIAATAATSSAFAFDSAPIEYDGKAGQYRHAIQQESDNFYCGAFCNPLAPSTETQRILGTNDILDASGNFTLNNSNRTITCQDASGNGFIQTSTDSNNLSAFGGWNYTEGGGRNVPLSGGTYEVCDIDLGASGKIAGGWTHTSSIAPVPGVGPIQFDTITSFDTKTMLVTAACTAPLDLAEGFAAKREKRKPEFKGR